MNGAHNLLTDFLFDGDGATVQREKSTTGTTGRDILTVDFALSVSDMPSSVREAPAFTDWRRDGSTAADLQLLGW